MEKITFCPDGEHEQDVYPIEQTVIAGKTYLLVTDTEDGDGEAFILRDDSDQNDEDGLYTIVEDENEIRGVGQIFVNLLKEDGIELDI